jgi:hypothetical protein
LITKEGEITDASLYFPGGVAGYEEQFNGYFSIFFRCPSGTYIGRKIQCKLWK